MQVRKGLLEVSLPKRQRHHVWCEQLLLAIAHANVSLIIPRIGACSFKCHVGTCRQRATAASLPNDRSALS